MSDLTNRDLIFCTGKCRESGAQTALSLASVGYLSKLRAVSYACPVCGHLSVVSLRVGAFQLPRPGHCWNCGVRAEPRAEACASCGVDPGIDGTRADGVFFTTEREQLAAEPPLGRQLLADRLKDRRHARDFPAALAASDTLCYQYPRDADAWREKAELYLEHGFLHLALHVYKKVLAFEARNGTTLLAFANVLELLDETEAALEVVSDAARLAPEDARLKAREAALRERLEDYAAAARAAQRAVELDPGSASAWGTLATLHMRKHEYAAAAAAWERALASAPDFPLAHRYQGFCHLALKQWSQAVEAGKRAGDQDHEALELIFEALLASGEHLAARAHAERCLTLYPEDTRHLYLLARAQMVLGAFEEGLTTCDTISRIEPSAEWPKRARAQFAARLAKRKTATEPSPSAQPS